MPFTESQPINIHELMLEEPPPQKELWFYASDCLTPEVIEDFKKIEDTSSSSLVNKKILGLIKEPTPWQQTALQMELTFEHPDNQNLHGKILLLTDMKMLGMDIEFGNEEQSYIENGNALILSSGKLMGHLLTEKEIDTDALNDELEWARENLTHTASPEKLVGLKILGIPFELKKEEIAILMNELEIYKIIGGDSYLHYITQLSILASDGLRIGNNGVELIYNTDLATQIPPQPQVRNF